MFDLPEIMCALTRHGKIARVVTVDVRGSGPREVGAAMLVWKDGQSGTIGGGTLEFEATCAARRALEQDKKSCYKPATITHHPLGPALGQCCGGAVTLVTEILSQADLKDLSDKPYFLRQISDTQELPLVIQRAMAESRAQGVPVETNLQDGWLIEPLHRATRPLWIWGAGHVGRAIVHTLATVPQFDITWVDTNADRFPQDCPATVTQLPATQPAQLVAYAPAEATHLIVTFSHALDLELCHQLLGHSFSFVGLIGSKTKWARFQRRLRDLGHSPAQISRITCPIGDPSLGKHPQSIAISVASKLLMQHIDSSAQRNIRA